MGDKTGRAYIVNEAHRLNKAAVRQLLTTLERIPAHVVWVFTTTVEGQGALFEGIDDAHPLLSRCVDLPLARRDLAKRFAKRAREIAQREGLAEGALRRSPRKCTLSGETEGTNWGGARSRGTPDPDVLGRLLVFDCQ